MTMVQPSLYRSATEICGKSDHVMVYGFLDCQYTRIRTCLSYPDSPFKKVYSYMLGYDDWGQLRVTHEGEKIPHVLEFNGYDPRRDLFVERTCKTTITDIVLANFDRMKKGKEIIPVLFCIDIDGSEWALEADDVASKTKILKNGKKANDSVTHKEMRRAYKLCFDEGVDPKVREAARETFKFVKVKLADSDVSGLERIEAPWQKMGWEAAWAKRKEGASILKPVKELDWRVQVNAYAKGGEEEMARAVETRKKAIAESKAAIGSILGSIV